MWAMGGGVDGGHGDAGAAGGAVVDHCGCNARFWLGIRGRGGRERGRKRGRARRGEGGERVREVALDEADAEVFVERDQLGVVACIFESVKAHGP